MAIQETTSNVMYYHKMRGLEKRQELMSAIRTSRGTLNQAPGTIRIGISLTEKPAERNISTK